MARRTIPIFFMLAALLACSHAQRSIDRFSFDDDPAARSDWWVSNYDELTRESDPRARRAHEIFERVHNAAGSRPGYIPKLVVIATDPYGTPRAEAIPDGGIVISKGVLDLCYKEERYGDDRLAFVLAHEIAHHIKGDFWHYRFFQALDAEEQGRRTDQTAVKEVRKIAEQTSDVQAKELQADVEAIGCTAMAGFNPQAIVSDQEHINFFAFWAEALDPAKLVNTKHGTPKQRAVAVAAKLNEIAGQTGFFQLGVLLYQAGKYCEAADAFRTFLATFPSREVYHNLAACHHQLGLRDIGTAQISTSGDTLQFELSFPIDTKTLASGTVRGGTGSSHMDKAIAMYTEAIKLDPEYPLPYIGLGCAYLQVDPYQGLAELRTAREKNPSSLEAMNSLGAAFYLIGNRKEAISMLEQALAADPAFAAPLLNLGVIAKAEHDEEQARQFFDAYLRLDPSRRVETIPPELRSTGPMDASQDQWARETIADVRPGMRLSEVPPEWGAPVSRQKLSTDVEECGPFPRHYSLVTYALGVVLVTDDEDPDEPFIQIVASSPECKATSNRGVGIGSTRQELEGAYGLPLRRFRTPQGECWVYDDDRRNLSFVMREGVVESWAAF
jgi:tetratricopeptide (TPR) repeat protein